MTEFNLNAGKSAVAWLDTLCRLVSSVCRLVGTAGEKKNPVAYLVLLWCRLVGLSPD